MRLVQGLRRSWAQSFECWAGKPDLRLAASGALLLALAARLLAVWRLSAQLEPDPDLYREIASHLVAGDGYATDRGPTAYRPPLYPLFLAAVRIISREPLAAGAAQIGVGLVTVFLTMGCARQAGLKRGAIVAGAIVAVDPLLLNATCSVMTESLAACLAASLMWWSVCPPESRTAGSGFFGGVLHGLAGLCRPTFYAFTFSAGLLAGIVGRTGQGRSENRGMNWQVWLATALGFAVVVLPWAARNAVVFGRFEVATSHGGYTLLLAHNPIYYDQVVNRPWGTVWDGKSLRAWQSSLEERLASLNPPLDIRPGQPVDEFARSRWMSEEGWRTLFADPAMAARSALTLLGRMWGLAPLGEPEGVPPFAGLAMGAFHGLVFVGALAGLWRLSRGEWRMWWPAAWLIVSFTLVHSLYWADMRMRAPLVPALALLAARALELRASIRGEDLRSPSAQPP